MPLTGDFGKLDIWAKKIERAASPVVRFEIADDMSDVALGLVAEGFGRQSDPYGRRWKPKRRADGRPTLRGKTGKLVQWRKAFVNQHGYRITSQAPYAKFHQSGTTRMVARKMTPDTGRPLPQRWVKALREPYLARMNKLLK